MDKSSKIFVAGHRGLIGSAFMRHFLREGYVNVITRTRAEMDLFDQAAVFDFFRQEKPEYVIFAAGKVGGIAENKTYPGDFITQNLEMQLNVFKAARECDVDRMVFFASSCMYPRECPQPMSESQLLTGKPEPTSIAYAVAKLAGVQMSLSYNEQYGRRRFIPVIPNSVFGPNDNFDPASGHVLSALINRFRAAKEQGIDRVTLWGSGSPRREFLFSDDLVSACMLLLNTDLDNLEMPLNIGPGEDVSIRELAEIIAKVVGYRGAVEWDTSKPDGTPRKLLDSSRMKALGWTTKTSLEDGIRQTYDWYLGQKAMAPATK
jgi:GDP-L-fucose synthase